MRMAEAGRTIGPSSEQVGKGGSAAVPEVSVEGSGPAAMPQEPVGADGSTAAPQEPAGADRSTTAPEVPREGGWLCRHTPE